MTFSPMIRKIFYKAAFLLFTIACSFTLAAQLTVRASVNKNKIFIGDQIELLLQVDVPETEAIRFFSIDTIPHFEFVEKERIDTTNTSNGTRLSQIIRITSFDSGSWMIPSFVLAEKIATDSIPVEVGFSPFDPNQPYHDIKDVIDVEEEQKKEWWWYAVGGGILLLLILYLLLRKKPKAVIKTETVAIDPYKEAITQLVAIQKQRPEIKQYYSSLTDIFRLYIYRRKGILSLQKTTDDLVLQVKSIDLPKDQFDKLAQALRLSDFVKFAKYQPAEADHAESWETIKHSIMTIEQSIINTSSQEEDQRKQ